MSDGTEEFASVAKEYCDWVERGPGEPLADAKAAMEHCLRLLLVAPSLRRTEEIEGISEDGDAPTVAAPDGRFADLPFQYYGEVSDPRQVPPERPVLGDLADDLADIYVDLKAGLLMWNAGKQEDAEFHWSLMYGSHWGEHATGAIRALYWFTRRSG